jgi:uncharacterized protein YyaL (SSP411 family)
MNLLTHETSPYLLQHAGNPVHWMPWGKEAFLKAAAENKPVLVSIGYSSCHWCHVMEHESFEDQETADLMNTLFINIKVDREEYPDVDHVYMDAVQAMTGSGGWPLNVFLTPDKKPFYGGTYFPPVRAHGRASWREVLMNVSQYFTQNREDVETQSSTLTEHLKQSSQIGKIKDTSVEEPHRVCEDIKNKLLANADSEHGGFGVAPKFPSTFSIKFLLNHYVLYGDEASLRQALRSLDKMMMGGIYDQIGGGFARYSTDTYWIAPHFEKMLYDNALLIDVYAIAYTITKNESYRQVIDETIAWLRREMTSHEGGFYSAQDADSEGEEGKYYTWSAAELNEILHDEYEWFAAYYHVSEMGNWEHTNILYSTYESQSTLSENHRTKLKAIHTKLIDYRNLRIKPMTDDKMLLGWNALMNKALVRAYLSTEQIEYLHLAEQNMAFLLKNYHSSAHLYFHTYRLGEAKIPAYADDLAFLADALICLGNATAETSYLLKAKEIADYMNSFFSSDEHGMYQFVHANFLQVDINKQEIYDGAIPSPNAVMCDVTNQLSYIFQEERYRIRSQKMRMHVAAVFQQYPGSFGLWCAAYQNQSQPFKEVLLSGNNAMEYYRALHNKKYQPAVMYITSNKKEEKIASLLGKYQEGETLIYICNDLNCLEPLRDVNMAFTEI